MLRNSWDKLGITSGLINSSLKLLYFVWDHENHASEIINSFKSIDDRANEAIRFLVDIRLINVYDNEIRIENSIVYFKNENPKTLYQAVLRSYILEFRPPWINRLHWGIKSVFNNLGLDEKHCFREAGLSDLNNFDVLKWWYSLSVYGESKENNSLTGLVGEFLTLQIEEERTGYKPRMMSSEGSKFGYDVLSRIAAGDSTKKFIEVKSISNKEKNEVYLTSNEWNTARKHLEQYYLHIWKLDESQRVALLYEFSASEFEKHVPLNSLSTLGKFELAKIDLTNVLNGISPITSKDLIKYKMQ